MIKQLTPSPEESDFAKRVAAKIGNGVRVIAFSLHDDRADTTSYRLLLSSGTKRHTIDADQPFHLGPTGGEDADPLTEVAQRASRWLATLSTARRWVTDPEEADRMFGFEGA